MTKRDSENRELTEDELNLVSGGTILALGHPPEPCHPPQPCYPQQPFRASRLQLSTVIAKGQRWPIAALRRACRDCNGALVLRLDTVSLILHRTLRPRFLCHADASRNDYSVARRELVQSDQHMPHLESGLFAE